MTHSPALLRAWPSQNIGVRRSGLQRTGIGEQVLATHGSYSVCYPGIPAADSREFSYGLLCARNTYRLNDTINSLSMGTLNRLQALVIAGTSAGLYELVATLSGCRSFQNRACGPGFPVCALRSGVLEAPMGHEVALFWGAHVAHHQSEDFNLARPSVKPARTFTVSFSISPSRRWLSGSPVLRCQSQSDLSVLGAYRTYPEVRPLEWRGHPSNHRVHHGRNEQYIDRNYGGVFIVWDRLFGTFQDELPEEPVIFGLSKPLKSWNPLWANIHVYWRLMLDCWHTPAC